MIVYVNAIMYYKEIFERKKCIFSNILSKVYDSNKAVSAVDDYNTSTRSLAAATLRNFLGTRNLGEILSERFLQSLVTPLDTHTVQGLDCQRNEVCA